MKNVKEVSRRSMYYEDRGMACGPVRLMTIDAEIVLDDNGKTVYLHGQWVNLAGDEIYHAAYSESAYDVYARLNKSDNDGDDSLDVDEDADVTKIEEAKIEDDSRYESFYKEMEKMIHNEMKEHGII